ncbi:hypothetical protein K7I13_11945 [Brucepastera parasyntrophica]|uniref:hypothetical protein n=1 Tax=Brucepastera parasyntrophica TaxID=2880008 RepID=UPI00210BA3E0|nr:hypothetical protein [Brucepastera parasyntrophica]ULQ59200.1 hypothetical protein K7I13_11945 [Brucepastera parasyntrophica]
MQNFIFENDVSMPLAVRNAVSEALPLFIETTDDSVLADTAMQISAAFGDEDDFRAIMTEKNTARDEAEKNLVSSFQKNIQLLVQKTWVEKSDIAMKEEVLYRIDALCKNLASYDYHTSLSEFLPILHDVVYLLFGTIARTDSFLEYAVRIDPYFGFFWYYINSLPAHNEWSEEKCRAAVMLGLCFLSNF